MKEVIFVLLNEFADWEGIEKDNVIGVQWHPESVLDMEIFEGFVTKKLQLSIGMISSTEK